MRTRCSVVTWQSMSPHVARLEKLHEGQERNLRGIRLVREHRLSEEAATQAHPIEAANQLALVPAFDRMGVALLVQLRVSSLDLGTNPGPLLPLPLRDGAAPNHPREARIDPDFEPPLPPGGAEAARDLESLGFEDEPRVGRPPPDRLARLEPGEDPLPVGSKKTFRGQVAADREQARSVGVLDGREHRPAAQMVDGHGALRPDSIRTTFMARYAFEPTVDLGPIGALEAAEADFLDREARDDRTVRPHKASTYARWS